MIMEVLEYHPTTWEKVFATEVNNLRFNLPKFRFNIEHIGATSVNNCRTFRNVDILLSVHDFKDIYTISMILQSKEYREVKEMSTVDCVVLSRKAKLYGCGVTLRIVQHASPTYNRFICFQIYLKESFTRVMKYNEFRETLFEQVKYNINEYNKVKYDYINSLIDENFKFE